MVLSAMSDDAEKSIKTMTEETNGEFDKMEILATPNILLNFN